MRRRRWAGIARLTIWLGVTACGTTSSSSSPIATVTVSGNAITGSGHIVSRQIPVTSFSQLEVASAFDVRVSVGATERVTLRVDDNLVHDLDVGVSGTTLRLDLKPGISVSHATLQADVTVPTLAGIHARGASTILLVDELRAPSLSATLSEASRVDGRIRTTQGRMELADASRAGLSGSVASLGVTASGASDLGAEGLTVRSLSIDLSGASTAEVTVTDSISARASGASSLRYRGSPRFTRKEISGGSSITPA